MAAKDREVYNAYMKAYMLKRYHVQRAEALVLLGGVCVQCGATTRLQLDHIDPKKKSFTLSNLWSRPRKSFLKELKKCQLLCKSCHHAKHATAKNSHGTLSSYKYCHCDLCRKVHSDYCVAWRRRRRARQAIMELRGVT